MFGLSNKAQFTLGLAWLIVGLFMGLFWLFDRPAVEITWQTETEFDTAGFNIQRSDTKQGPFVRANDRLIPASEDAAAGADYAYLDTNVTSGKRYYYQLEDIDLEGNVTKHAPISLEAPGRHSWILVMSVALVLIGLILMVTAWRSDRHR